MNTVRHGPGDDWHLEPGFRPSAEEELWEDEKLVTELIEKITEGLEPQDLVEILAKAEPALNQIAHGFKVPQTDNMAALFRAAKNIRERLEEAIREEAKRRQDAAAEGRSEAAAINREIDNLGA